VLHNDALLQIYCGLADVIRPGITYGEILDAGLQRGLWDTDGLDRASWREKVLAARRNASGEPLLIRFSSGRIMLQRSIRTDTGMLIATCADVTELEGHKADALSAEARSHQLRIDLERTVDMLDMAIVIIDEKLHVELVNRAFWRLWNVSPDAVEAGCPFRDLLEADRHTGVYGVADHVWEDYGTRRLAEIRGGEVAPREFRRADGCTLIYSVVALSGGRRLIS